MFANDLYPGPISVGPNQDPNGLNSDSVPKDFFEKNWFWKKNQQTKKKKTQEKLPSIMQDFS